MDPILYPSGEGRTSTRPTKIWFQLYLMLFLASKSLLLWSLLPVSGHVLPLFTWITQNIVSDQQIFVWAYVRKNYRIMLHTHIKKNDWSTLGAARSWDFSHTFCTVSACLPFQKKARNIFSSPGRTQGPDEGIGAILKTGGYSKCIYSGCWDTSSPLPLCSQTTVSTDWNTVF